MRIFHEEDMVKGWFVGNFNPTALKLDTCEVGLKRYKAGDFEDTHVHKIATEVTMVVEGRIKMNNITYEKGSIIVIDPGEYATFSVLEDSVTLVVKSPCIPGDKYALHST